MGTVIVSGVFTVGFDLDEFRGSGPDALTDEEILEECIASVSGNWDFYASQPDTLDVFGEIAA